MSQTITVLFLLVDEDMQTTALHRAVRSWLMKLLWGKSPEFFGCFKKDVGKTHTDSNTGIYKTDKSKINAFQN